MGEKTRPPPGNRNRIVTEGFSNSESEKRYRLMWAGEAAVLALYETGNQCGGCTFYAVFDSDWGLCCNARSRHHTETVFEHFTCANTDQESWGAHRFQARESRLADRNLDELPVMTPRGWHKARRSGRRGGRDGDPDS